VRRLHASADHHTTQQKPVTLSTVLREDKDSHRDDGIRIDQSLQFQMTAIGQSLQQCIEGLSSNDRIRVESNSPWPVDPASAETLLAFQNNADGLWLVFLDQARFPELHDKVRALILKIDGGGHPNAGRAPAVVTFIEPDPCLTISLIPLRDDLLYYVYGLGDCGVPALVSWNDDSETMHFGVATHGSRRSGWGVTVLGDAEGQPGRISFGQDISYECVRFSW
jgi:hypothetical protein